MGDLGRVSAGMYVADSGSESGSLQAVRPNNGDEALSCANSTGTRRWHRAKLHARLEQIVPALLECHHEVC